MRFPWYCYPSSNLTRKIFSVFGWPQKIHQLEVDFNNKKHHNKNTRWWFQNIFYFHPNLGKWSIWNHQLENMFFEIFVESLSRGFHIGSSIWRTATFRHRYRTGMDRYGWLCAVYWASTRRGQHDSTVLFCCLRCMHLWCHPGKVFMFQPSNAAFSKNTPKKTQTIAAKNQRK